MKPIRSAASRSDSKMRDGVEVRSIMGSRPCRFHRVATYYDGSRCTAHREPNAYLGYVPVERFFLPRG